MKSRTVPYDCKSLRSFLVFILVLFCGTTMAKDYFVIIDSISITGNKQSKSFIIERELLFKKDSVYRLSELDEMASGSRNLLINTNLYILVDVSWKETRYQHIQVDVSVVEKWYVWPIPKFALADRNYKQWADLGYKLNRTNYGIQLFTYNFRGRNETVKITLINGYTQNFGLIYTVPFLEKTGKIGLDLSTSYMQNREIWYLTKDDRLQFYKNFEDVLLKRWLNSVAFTSRRNYYATDRLEIEYNVIHTGDTVHGKGLNPNFLLEGRRQQEVGIKHVFTYEKRDNKYYPLTGAYFKNELGLGSVMGDTASVELVRESIEAGVYRKIDPRVFFSVFGKAKITNQPAPFIPYYNYKAFGYNDYVRGYEQYVVDGYAFVLAKVNLKYAVLRDHLVRMPVKINQSYPRIPFGIFLNLYADYGKVWNSQWQPPLYNYNNDLPGKDLIGYGAGLDFLVLNDKIVRMEYSLNRQGDKNFNLHFKKAF